MSSCPITSKRFSRSTLTEYLQEQVNLIQYQWGFDPDNGTAQLDAIAADRLIINPLRTIGGRDADMEGHRHEARMAYGELEMLRRIAQDFDLEVYLIPEGFTVSRCTGTSVKRYLYPGKA